MRLSKAECQRLGFYAVGCAANLGCAYAGRNLISAWGMLLRSGNGQLVKIKVSFVAPELAEEPLDNISPILDSLPPNRDPKNKKLRETLAAAAMARLIGEHPGHEFTFLAKQAWDEADAAVAALNATRVE